MIDSIVNGQEYIVIDIPKNTDQIRVECRIYQDGEPLKRTAYLNKEDIKRLKNDYIDLLKESNSMEKRIGIFKKVSFEQYYKDYVKCYGAANKELVRYVYEKIKLPQRATVGSGAYDFFIPETTPLKVGKSVTIPTGITALYPVGWALLLFPRSGHGFKCGISLANSVGLIDSDYSRSDNEGHIHVKLLNDSCIAQDMEIPAGEAMCQGMFVQYGLTLDDHVTEERNGGFGSTSK